MSRPERLAFLLVIPSTGFPSERLSRNGAILTIGRVKVIAEVMLDSLGVGFGSICFLFGIILFFTAISDSKGDQTLPVIGGALLLSLGMVAVWRVMANKLKWWRAYKRYRERTD